MAASAVGAERSATQAGTTAILYATGPTVPADATGTGRALRRGRFMSTAVGSLVGGIVGSAIAVGAITLLINRSAHTNEGLTQPAHLPSAGSQTSPRAKSVVGQLLPADQPDLSFGPKMVAFTANELPGQERKAATDESAANSWKAEQDFATNIIANLFRGQTADAIRNNKDVLSGRINWDKIRARALSGLDTNWSLSLTGQVNELWKEALGALKGDTGLIARIANSLADGGSFEFLDVRPRDYKAISDDKANTRTVALFRLIKKNPNGMSCNDLYYYDFVLEKTPGANGNVEIVDLYDYLSGEDLSQSLHRTFLVSFGGQLSGDMNSRPEDKAYWGNIEKINALRLALIGNDLAAFKKIYAALPLVVQSDESVLILYLQAAIKHNDPDEVAAAHARFSERDRNSYPDPDPAANLIAMAGWVRMNRPDDAIQCVNRLETSLALRREKTDPYLDVIRAYIFAKAAQPDIAKKLIINSSALKGTDAGRNGGPIALNNAAFILLYVTKQGGTDENWSSAATSLTPILLDQQRGIDLDQKWLNIVSSRALTELQGRSEYHRVASAIATGNSSPTPNQPVAAGQDATGAPNSRPVARTRTTDFTHHQRFTGAGTAAHIYSGA